jgi:hypothetical protein
VVRPDRIGDTAALGFGQGYPASLMLAPIVRPCA